MWTLGFLILSVLCFVVALLIDGRCIQYVIVVLSAIRVFEYFVYLFWVVLFARPNKGLKDIRSYRRSLLLLMCNFVETVFWFATWYSVLAHKGLLTAGSPWGLTLLRESLVLMVGNSTGGVVFVAAPSLFVATLQVAMGLFMTLVIVSRMISLLPRPTSADPDEQEQ